MRTADLAYDLPPGLIAQVPVEPRSASRLLVCRRGEPLLDRRFDQLLDLVADDVLVVANDTRVLPVRVALTRATGGAAELLLLEPLSGGDWTALGRPYARLRLDEPLTTADGLEFVVREKLGEGRLRVSPPAGVALEEALRRAGQMPLPPYIREPLADADRYQTVYAQDPGSAAAPTAGLHFTDQLWAALQARNEVVTITLGVGLDTFRPVAEDDLDEHPMHSERYAVSAPAAAAIEGARRDGRDVLAVGTTSVRVLETVFADAGPAPSGPLEGRTELLIQPGHRFTAVDAMITNFHLPRSTLLALVMAFAGVEETRAIYRTAVERRYRFYSFGDACLITR